MKFNEFIVLLCLVYLLKEDPAALHAVSIISNLSIFISFKVGVYYILFDSQDIL